MCTVQSPQTLSNYRWWMLNELHEDQNEAKRSKQKKKKSNLTRFQVPDTTSSSFKHDGIF